jgi:hypothetical protein
VTTPVETVAAPEGVGPAWTANPVQRRILDELLCVGTPRPPADETLADRLDEELLDLTAPGRDLVPPGERLFLSKSRLDALSCDGRYLDLAETPFEWSPAIVRGQLAHGGIDLDLAGRQTRDAAALIDHAWEQLATSGTSAGDFLASLGGVEADDLRAQARRIVLDFRDQFPHLPEEWHPRTEQALRRQLHDGRVVVQGKPDLQVGRPTVDRRRMLLVDLKTGGRHPLRHRADMRFYALLATLKHRVAPFRVATYYLDEADWDAEDVDEDVLRAALRHLAEGVNRAALLEYGRPDEAYLRLLPGPQCNWCGRASSCPAKAHADAERADAWDVP